MSMERSSIERYFYDLLLSEYFFALACLTTLALLNDFSLSTAVITVFLNLLVHAWAHLIHLHNSSFSLASFTSFDFSSSLPITSLTSSGSLMRYLQDFSIVALLQGHFERLLDRLSFGLLRGSTSASPTSSKEHIEKV